MVGSYLGQLHVLVDKLGLDELDGERGLADSAAADDYNLVNGNLLCIRARSLDAGPWDVQLLLGGLSG